MPFGEYDSNATPSVDPGVYDAIIESASLVYETTNGVTTPKRNDNGKALFDVFFTIDASTKLKRRYSISFGQNTTNKQWSAFAKMLEVATGVRCGDPVQKELDDHDLVGKRVRIVVETNDRGYADVSNVLPSAKQNGRTAQPQPVAAGSRRPTPPQEDDSFPIDRPDVDDELDEIPF